MNLLYYGGGGLAALAVIMISYSSYTILNSNIPTIQLDDSERLKDVSALLCPFPVNYLSVCLYISCLLSLRFASHTFLASSSTILSIRRSSRRM